MNAGINSLSLSKRMTARWLLLAILLLAGCVSIPSRYASIECVCRASAPPVYQVFLHAPTGSWALTGHGVGLYRETAVLSIQLPDMPATQARYDAAQVSVVDQSPYPSVALAATGGHVLIDQKTREVTVSLQTPDGPLWANGVYPMRYGRGVTEPRQP